MKPHSQKFLQQRRFYMVLPLLVFPFITMIFWALGGGQGTPVQAQEVKSGLNLSLPGAHFNNEDELWDKFTLYEKAKRDSLRYEEARRNDPYYVVTTLKEHPSTDTLYRTGNKLNTSLGIKDKYVQINEHEQQINLKLAEITQQINQPDPRSGPTTISKPALKASAGSQNTADSDEVDRLEKMMQLMASPDANDPEMQQIDQVLEKILDIQHPQRMKDKIREHSLEHKAQVFPVKIAEEEDNISLVENPLKNPRQLIQADSSEFSQKVSVTITSRNSFYGLDDEPAQGEENSNAIEAVIHDTQTVVAGSTVKMRLLSDVFINGRLIEKDHFIYGICAVNGERLTITINTIRDEDSLLPVALQVYDLDGQEGIYIPGAVARDAAKKATSQSIQDMQMYSMDNSIGVQAATAGIEAAKGLFSKKAKLLKITIKPGYQLLLQHTNQPI